MVFCRKHFERTCHEEESTAIAAAAAVVLALSACGNGGSAESAKGEISYWLWDANQLPAYQQCADDFHKANPT